jgi:tRNA (uracil-5-)-methyltransferase
MVIILHAPAKGGAGAKEDGSDDCTEAFESEKKRLVELLTQCVIPTPKRDYPEGHVAEEKKEDEEGIRVTSIFFQEFEGLSHPTPDHPVQHVFGKKSIEENLGKCSFQISPGAFFQTNTQGAEVLYDIVVQRIKEVTPDPQQTLLLDVCCGTGTIGLTCLKEGVVGRLVGVDIAAPAIADAKINAKKNDYTDSATTQFIASAAEKVLPETMKDLPRDKPIVAVVDPARDGLHGIVVRTLRANSKIQRLVYVSCNPTGTLVRDAAMLCSPPTKKYPGRPFKPVKSQPVDMFPLTKHCEMVMTFDRMSKDEYEKYHGVEEK